MDPVDMDLKAKAARAGRQGADVRRCHNHNIAILNLADGQTKQLNLPLACFWMLHG